MSWVGTRGREGGLSGQCSLSPSASHSTADCLENQEGIYSGMVTPLLWFPKGSTISQGKSKRRKSERTFGGRRMFLEPNKEKK